MSSNMTTQREKAFPFRMDPGGQAGKRSELL
jgi:hypothetical protein